MRLDEILKGIAYEAYHNGTACESVPEKEIKGITFDSRKVRRGTLFVAQKGVHVDGHDYIATAQQQGAVAVVCQKLPNKLRKSVCYIKVKNSDLALGIAASNFYGNPSRQLHLVGITGTNGKTTTVTLLHRLMRDMGLHAGLLSTIVNKIDDEELPATHTTPDAIELNALLKKMVGRGCTYCFMEVSSHAIVQNRIAGLHFAGAIFSNITHDHLDYHKTMENYIAAKKAFFDQLPAEAFALTNIDDNNGRVMVQNCKGRIHTYSLRTMADFRARIVESTLHGQLIELNGESFWTPLVGRFNAYNITAIVATAILCGLKREEVLVHASRLQAAPGRFQVMQGSGVTAIIDYAHTPDALQNVADTILEVRNPRHDLIIVVGCGGDRDPLKRPVMARIAAERADQLILTSDNPRSEDPEHILDSMEKGIETNKRFKCLRISDRRQAIRAAFMIAKEGDIILIAGKGHEPYQEIMGERHHFDDCEEAAQGMQLREARKQAAKEEAEQNAATQDQ